MFYRASSPGAKLFVEVGDRVTSRDTIGLTEVMKHFNAVAAGYEGRVVKILAENGSIVEQGQHLVLIAPVVRDPNDG